MSCQTYLATQALTRVAECCIVCVVWCCTYILYMVPVPRRLADEAKVSRAQARTSESYSDSEDELSPEDKRKL